jgi:hypothetical protein
MTTVNRLFVKGLLARREVRQGQGGSYTYTPTSDEDAFVISTVHQLLDCVVRDYPSAVTDYLDTQHEVAAD